MLGGVWDGAPIIGSGPEAFIESKRGRAGLAEPRIGRGLVWVIPH